MRVVMYDGSPDERKQLRADIVDRGAFTVLITHYDLAIRDKAALKKARESDSIRPFGQFDL